MGEIEGTVMERLTEKDQYSQDYKIQAKNLNSHCVAKDAKGYITYYGQHIDKLAEYEDLEERLNKVYGDCDGLLLSVIEALEKHSSIDIANNTLKSRLLTDEDVDKWEEYKQLEEQGRLVKLPCKIGTEVYDITWWDNVQEKVVIKGKAYHRTVYKHKVTKLPFTYSDIDNFGKTVFLTKSEAKQKLKEMESD